MNTNSTSDSAKNKFKVEESFSSLESKSKRTKEAISNIRRDDTEFASDD